MRDSAVITRFELRSIVAFVLVFSAIVAIAAVALGMKRQANERAARVATQPASTDFEARLTSAEMRGPPTVAKPPNVEPLNAPPEPISTGPGTLSIIHNEGLPDVPTPSAAAPRTFFSTSAPAPTAPPTIVGIGGVIGYGGAIDDTWRTQAQTLTQMQSQAPPDSQTFTPANAPAQNQTASGQVQMSAQQQQTPAQLQAQISQQSQTAPAQAPAQGQTQPAPAPAPPPQFTLEPAPQVAPPGQ